MKQPKMPGQILAPLLAICALTFSLAGIVVASDKPKSGSDSSGKHYERLTDPSFYVGAETCKTCHEDIFKNFETTPHFVTTLDKAAKPATGRARNTWKAAATKQRYSPSRVFPRRQPASAVWTATAMARNTPILPDPRTCKTMLAVPTATPLTTPGKASS